MIDDFKVTTATLGTQDFFADNFAVFPNPAEKLLNIRSEKNTEVKSVQIADCSGRIVKIVSEKMTSNAQIAIEDLTTGMYLVSILTENGMSTTRFLKK